MMVWAKYKLMPQDIAVYLFLENASHKRENEILWDLFENHNQMIVRDYRKFYLHFKQSVMNLLTIFELDDASYNGAELILMETEHGNLYSDEEVDCFGAYFKLIWLQLTYSGIFYRKIKLRNLLRDFGYKRRTVQLVNSINNALNALRLKTYQRDYEECDICNAGLDDMIIIRLMKEKL